MGIKRNPRMSTLWTLDYAKDIGMKTQSCFCLTKRISLWLAQFSIPAWTLTSGLIKLAEDLESVCYMLIYFIKGELPWQGLNFEHKFEKDHMIMESKLKLNPNQVCSGLPIKILNVLEYVKSLDFYEDPDYRYIISELTHAYER